MKPYEHPPKVLICDDEEDILTITRLILEEDGYRVVTVNDSLMVIKEIRNQMPDLVLIDLSMPGMTGDQVVDYLKHEEKLNKIPVIVFSANVDGKVVAFHSGADDFLDKPFDVDHLLTLVNKHIKSA